MQVIQSIQNRIYEIRSERVILDFDIAKIYETDTKRINEAVKRNKERFPNDFMFQLTKIELSNIQFHIESNDNAENSLRSQFATSNRGGNRYMPFAFTEHGVAMLSGILSSDKAIAMNIAIMRAFVELRKILVMQNDVKEQLIEIKQHLGEHDVQLNQIYDTMENLIDEKASQRKWDDRERIGYKKK